jgi:hypothetical protein
MNTKRGWSSAGLPLIEGHYDIYWSTTEAAYLLGPPQLSEEQVRQLVHLVGMQPVGKRWVKGRGTRHVRVYRANELIRAYEAIAGVIESIIDANVAHLYTL